MGDDVATILHRTLKRMLRFIVCNAELSEHCDRPREGGQEVGKKAHVH